MRRATIGETWQNQLKFAMWCCKKSVEVADMYLRPRLEMLCINLKIAQCISCHPYHLLGPLHDSCLLFFPPSAGSWVSSDDRLMDLQPMGWGGRGVVAHPRRTYDRMQGYTLTRWRPFAPLWLCWSRMTSPAVCGCTGVKGHSSANDGG